MITAHEALRQCVEAMKEVDFADCGKDDARWHKLNAAQQVAEEVLREDKQSEIWHVQKLRDAAADPMSHDHAEVSKSLLIGAANIIEAASARIVKLKADATDSQPSAAPSGDAWQPIETAPKDGTRILIGRAGHPWTFVAGWNPHRQHWAYGSDAMSYLPMATHWKPSPLAPTATKE